jgi:hypothetical protein
MPESCFLFMFDEVEGKRGKCPKLLSFVLSKIFRSPNCFYRVIESESVLTLGHFPCKVRLRKQYSRL